MCIIYIYIIHDGIGAVQIVVINFFLFRNTCRTILTSLVLSFCCANQVK